tara:strand:- start:2976 stop:3821 length:846 start_codon:yes stop_codon:yes gene_type:complete
MAWRFKQELVQDNQVVEPSEFRINANEFVGELNGMLDMDNIGQLSIQRSQIKRGAFTQVFSQNNTPAVAYYFNYSEETGWTRNALMRQDANNGNVGGSEYVVSTQSIGLENETQLTPTIGDAVQKLPHCRFEAKTDGLVKAEFSGFVQWLTISEGSGFVEDDYKSFSGSGINDNYPYQSGETKTLSQAHAFILCNQWRLSINGQPVAETGILGPEFKSRPIYLCGVSPVQKSREINVQLEGRFFWYSPLTQEMKSPSSFKANRRRDCALCCPTLIATFRKR